MLKRITIALGLVSCSAIAIAGTPGNPMAQPLPSGVVLVAPDSIGAWSFGIEALYVQPTAGNFQYTEVVDGNERHNESVEPDYGWGGEADITYHFAGSSHDISLGYTHLDTDNSDTTQISGLETFGPSLAFLSSDPDQVKGTMDDDYNAADLTVGQQLLVGNRLVLHPFIGVRFADISTDNKATASNSAISTDTGTARIDSDSDSDFEGAGPRAGIDIRVLSNCGLSLVGTMGGSLLVGSEDSHADFVASPLQAFGTIKKENDDTVNLVPELDARIGLDYTPHKLFPAGSMGFQLGYEVVHYFNVSDLDYIDSVLINSANNQSDYSYQGPYFRLQLNIA